MAQLNEYISFKSNHGRIRIDIKTSDNTIRIKGRLQSTDPEVESVSIDKGFMLDDPERNQKVGNIWNQFKTALNGLATHAISEMESKYTDYVQSL